MFLHVFGCYSKVNLSLTLNYLQSLIYGSRRIFRHPTWWGSEKIFVADFCTIAVNLRTRARCSLDTWEFFEKHILLNIPKPTRIQMSNLKFGLFVKMDQSITTWLTCLSIITLDGDIRHSWPQNSKTRAGAWHKYINMDQSETRPIRSGFWLVHIYIFKASSGPGLWVLWSTMQLFMNIYQGFPQK